MEVKILYYDEKAYGKTKIINGKRVKIEQFPNMQFAITKNINFPRFFEPHFALTEIDSGYTVCLCTDSKNAKENISNIIRNKFSDVPNSEIENVMFIYCQLAKRFKNFDATRSQSLTPNDK